MPGTRVVELGTGGRGGYGMARRYASCSSMLQMEKKAWLREERFPGVDEV